MTFVWAGLGGLMILVAISIWITIQTGVLAASIYILSGDNDNPFKEDGPLIAWGKCGGLVACVAVLSFIPGFGGLLALLGWFLGIMMLFERSFGQTIMIFLANIVLGFLLNWILGLLLL